jgi:hypothetical protein
VDASKHYNRHLFGTTPFRYFIKSGSASAGGWSPFFSDTGLALCGRLNQKDLFSNRFDSVAGAVGFTDPGGGFPPPGSKHSDGDDQP